jgi:hypothetical protein
MNSEIHPPIHILTAGVIGVFSLFAQNTAFAIEPPPDNAKPPAALWDHAESIDQAQAKLPFIGVVTASLPDMVADHLNLKHGTGVIVRTVLPNGPADQSGLKTNDIILSINDDVINDPEAFSAKIRNLNIGDKLKLKTIQQGKPADIEVTLGERPAGQVAEGFNQEPMLDGLPEIQAQRLRDMIERNLDALGQNGFEEMPESDGLADEKFRMLRERMDRAFRYAPEIDPEHLQNFQFQRQSTIRMMDSDGSIEIKSNGESSEAIVRDQANEIIWSGPWDTEKDKSAAPDDIRQRIEKLSIQKSNGFSFRLGK